mgnify:CR=1 FL=1
MEYPTREEIERWTAEEAIAEQERLAQEYHDRWYRLVPMEIPHTLAQWRAYGETGRF